MWDLCDTTGWKLNNFRDGRLFMSGQQVGIFKFVGCKVYLNFYGCKILEIEKFLINLKNSEFVVSIPQFFFILKFLYERQNLGAF